LSYRSPVIDRLLPMMDLRPFDVSDESAAAPPTERGFPLRLTPEGEDQPMLQFDLDPLLNRDVWSSLPGHLWGLFGRAKPGATVYAYAVRPGEADDLDAQRRGAIIVQQHYGFGQVLWIGIDSTWRWRHRVGDEYHHRFWGQLGRWAAENKTAAGNRFVKFGPDRSDIDVGDDVMLRARWTSQFLRRFPHVTAQAELYRVGEDDSRPFSVIDLQPVDTRPLIHEARVVSPPAGEYRVRLVVEGADLGEEIETPLYVNEKPTPELSDLSANRDLLQQLADASRSGGPGKVYLPDEVGEIPALFRDPAQDATLSIERPLWDRWWVLIAFFALLTTEWVVRKLNGLP
ncbi:MAG: hypothetical protein ACREIV_14955, partial [Planctomycetaceae bacterium]